MKNIIGLNIAKEIINEMKYRYGYIIPNVVQRDREMENTWVKK